MQPIRITLRSQLTGMAFATPYLVGFVVFLALPLAMSLYYAFTDWSMLNTPMWIGADNFRRLAADPIFLKVLKNTLIYAAASVPLTLTASVLLAVLLNVRIPGQPCFRVIVYLPSLVPAVAAAMVWLIVFNGKRGLLNQVLSYVIPGAALPNWLQNESWVMPTIVLLSLWGIGNAVIIFLAGLQDIPAELYEAAEIDGASTLQKLRHVTLPMLSPVIFFNVVMGIIASFQVFTLPFILVGQGANRGAYFYSMYLFDAAFMERRFGAASAMAWIQFLIILVLTVAVVISSRKWVHYR